MALISSSAHVEPVGILSLPYLQPSWITSPGQPARPRLSGHTGNSTEWEDGGVATHGTANTFSKRYTL